MPHDPKPNEWNLLKEQFDQMVRSEIVREDYTIEQFLDDEIRRRFGEWISRAVQAS